MAHHKSSSYSITRARDRALRSHRNRSQIFVKNTFPVTEHSYVAMRFDQHVYLWIVQTLRATQTDRTRTAPQYKRLRQSRASHIGLSRMHDACRTRSLRIASQHAITRHEARQASREARLSPTPRAQAHFNFGIDVLVVPRQLWMAFEYPLAFGIHLVGV